MDTRSTTRSWRCKMQQCKGRWNDLLAEGRRVWRRRRQPRPVSGADLKSWHIMLVCLVLVVVWVGFILRFVAPG